MRERERLNERGIDPNDYIMADRHTHPICSVRCSVCVFLLYLKIETVVLGQSTMAGDVFID